MVNALLGDSVGAATTPSLARGQRLNGHMDKLRQTSNLARALVTWRPSPPCWNLHVIPAVISIRLPPAKFGLGLARRGGALVGGGQGFTVGRDTQSITRRGVPRGGKKHGLLVASKCAATHVMSSRNQQHLRGKSPLSVGRHP
ncbi:hypothetical protein N8I77_004214 [Diaporthe amygdali]|uniref:Uncharacterized protein n=1 Tax=Phomopsis amygdali TaxID=1214568 RepID=A0AAD9SKF6_PHOAM|nr:hypothetical protein N8I77_004214 [Diaporthe amygdali]